MPDCYRRVSGVHQQVQEEDQRVAQEDQRDEEPSVIISDHQKRGFCVKCWNDATANNHCAWCGEDFDNLAQLMTHLDQGCNDKIKKAMGSLS